MLKQLQDFIKQKVEAYQEPQREGTPRGEAVGLSRVKYHATLLSALTCLSGKEIAKRLRISYGLLLKWRTEPAFKELLNRHMGHRGRWEYLATVTEEANRRCQALKEALQRHVTGETKTGVSPEPYTFPDADYWGVALVAALCRYALNAANVGSPISRLELLRAIRALEKQKKVYFRQLTGRPNSSWREVADQFSLAIDFTESPCRQMFQGTIDQLEAAILDAASKLLVGPEPIDRATGFFLVKALSNDKKHIASKIVLPAELLAGRH